MNDLQKITPPLALLYPDTAKVFFSSQCPAFAELLPAELGITTSMVEKRRAEFTHGRHCARSAMQMLGLEAVPILKGPDREPVWPQGIVGSITHTEGAAAAVVARANDLVAIGLDMEVSDPLSSDLISMICLPDENPNHDGTRGKLLFSIKEAIYKCLFPLINEYVDFLEMEVRLDEAAMTFSATPRAARLDKNLIGRIRGRYTSHSSYVISGAWIS